MPKFKIEVEFDLYTEIEYDGYGDIGDSSEAEDYENNSYFGSESVVSSGGNVTFTVEADGEGEAIRLAELVIADGTEVEDRNGLTWSVQSASYSAELDEMTRDEAFVIVRRLLDRLVAENHITSEEREALDLVIQDS